MLKLLGHIVDDGERLWMISSAAEIGFRVTGATKVILELSADDTVLDPEKEPDLPRFEIRLNGKQVADTRLTAKEETVTVFDGAEARDAEIRLIKLNESTSNLMALKRINTDGKISPLPKKPMSIEFIGDSITCGYGVEGKSEAETFTTATENAEKSYAFLTAETLNADTVMTCFSGHGLISGYTDNPSVRNEADLVQPFYEKEGRNDFRMATGKRAEETERDFTAFQPDWIVLNLGTNDLSWCGTKPERGVLFAEQYTAFLKTVRKHNPKAEILCILGVMGTGLNPMMQLAVENYGKETGDQAIHVLMLEEQNAARDGYGADYHPNEITQRLLAGKVTDAIRQWTRQ
jgi:lysophospholipase L1-like esterase